MNLSFNLSTYLSVIFFYLSPEVFSFLNKTHNSESKHINQVNP